MCYVTYLIICFYSSHSKNAKNLYFSQKCYCHVIYTKFVRLNFNSSWKQFQQFSESDISFHLLTRHISSICKPWFAFTKKQDFQSFCHSALCAYRNITKPAMLKSLSTATLAGNGVFSRRDNSLSCGHAAILLAYYQARRQ